MLLAGFAPGATAAANDSPTSAPAALVQSAQVDSGRLGFAAFDFQTSTTYHIRGAERFPMQSVFKAMMAVEVLRQIDGGKLSVDQEIEIGRDDLSVYWSPIAEDFKDTTQTYTIRKLLELSVGWSDNTAADVLMELVGGPQQVTTMLRNADIDGISIDRYEREFQAELEGLPPFKLGEVVDRAAFVKAAEAVPTEKKRPILERNVSGLDTRDTATPLATVKS